MATIKQNYFTLKKESNKYLNISVIKFLLIELNNFKDFSELVLNFDKPCLNEDKLFKYASKIKEGYPYQYLLGHMDFLDIDIYIKENVLIPRQESEQLCIIAKQIIKETYQDKNINIIDMCSGSGCLSLYLAKHLPNSIVGGFDISDECVSLAKENNKKLNLNVNYFKEDIHDFIKNNTKKYDVLICNPPYIKDESSVEFSTLKYEPHKALFASPNYYFYELIFANFKSFLNEDKFLMFFEISEDLQEDLTNLLNIYLDKCSFVFKKDIYNKVRFLIVAK